MVERLRGRAGQAQRLRRLKRTDGLCEHCLKAGRPELATEVNHIKPLAHGGSDEDSNTENLCTPCHEKVTAEQFGHRPPVQAVDADGWPVADGRCPPPGSKV